MLWITLNLPQSAYLKTYRYRPRPSASRHFSWYRDSERGDYYVALASACKGKVQQEKLIRMGILIARAQHIATMNTRTP